MFTRPAHPPANTEDREYEYVSKCVRVNVSFSGDPQGSALDHGFRIVDFGLRIAESESETDLCFIFHNPKSEI